ncbi:hypothetical protein LOK49_LG14G00908 [Camellia lanceoleosa]|uniref:Uncharacterized protein n=1 Tax=Camellia lanceoleosa TaxID=1840588 RepID=A0ACC0FCK7_9ERIC|nr:hypothetical protein LOK49_LG14G00908 [Camellia lanceoleosa]
MKILLNNLKSGQQRFQSLGIAFYRGADCSVLLYDFNVMKSFDTPNNWHEEFLMQVHWQETLRGYVAGVLTAQRVLIVSADLDILASNSTKFDKELPSIYLDGKLIAYWLLF